MKIENIDKGQYLKLDFKYNYDGYNTYDISGKNGEFQGKNTICISLNNLEKFKNDLLKVQLNDSVKLCDYDSDAYITVKKTNQLGHFEIFLQIGGSYEDNYLKMKISTDHIGIENFQMLN